MGNRAFSVDQSWLQHAVFGATHQFTEHVLRCSGFAGIQKAVVNQTGSRPPDSDHDLLLMQVWLWEVLWSFFLVQPLSWSSLIVYKIHFLSHITIWWRNGLLLLRRIREGDTSKWQFFWFLVSSWKWKSLSHVQHFETPRAIACQAPLSMGFSRQEYWKCCHSLLQGFFPTQGSNPGLLHCRWILYHLSHQGSSWGTHLLNIFTFPVCFKRRMAVEWLMLSSWATVHVVVRGSALMILSIGSCQLPIASHYALIFKALVSFAKLLESPLQCMFISSSWAECVGDVSSCICCFATQFELE